MVTTALSRVFRRASLDQRAGAMLGEQFEQHRMRHLAVDDHNGLDAFRDHVEAALDLGDHAAGNRAVVDQFLRFGRCQRLDQLSLLVEHAVNVGQEQETLRLRSPWRAPPRMYRR